MSSDEVPSLDEGGGRRLSTRNTLPQSVVGRQGFTRHARAQDILDAAPRSVRRRKSHHERGHGVDRVRPAGERRDDPENDQHDDGIAPQHHRGAARILRNLRARAVAVGASPEGALHGAG